MVLDPDERALGGLILGLLASASIVCWFLRRPSFYERRRALVEETITRTNAWWVMAGIVLGALAMGRRAVIVLFFFISVGALREYLTLVPTRRGDHRAMFWAFAVFCPIQYYLLWIEWYGLFSIFIPVYAFLLIPSRIVLQQDCTSFLERTAKIQWGLMLCVYAVGHAPAILSLDLAGYPGKQHLLFVYVIFLTELSDVLQFVAGKSLGKHTIAPGVSPNKTWEGFLGGFIGIVLLSVLLAPHTPFSRPQAAAVGALVVVTGFLGGLTMSAIKRDVGIKDYGNVIAGHGGVLDRIDSLCFTAPIFFHYVRYFYTG